MIRSSHSQGKGVVAGLRGAFAPILALVVGGILLSPRSAGGEGRATEPSEVSPDWPSDDSSPEYVAHRWTREQGLPNSSVWALERGRSGALWVGTLDGLARFDGHSFSTFDAVTLEGLAGNRILALHQASDGALWVGTASGASVRRDGRFRPVDSLSGAVAIDEGPEGTVWLGGGDGLYRTASGTVRPVPLPDSLADSRVMDIENVGPDSVWVVAGRHLLLYRNGVFEHPRSLARSVGKVGRIAAARGEILYVAAGSRVVSIQDGGVTRSDPHEGVEVRSMRVAPSGNVWLTTSNAGLLRWSEASLRRVRGARSIPDELLGLTQDDSGQWWIGTQGNGLVRLRPRLFQHPEGTSGENGPIHGLYSDDEKLWAGTYSRGLIRIAGSAQTQWTTADGLPSNRVLSVTRDGEGTLWVATGNGLVRRQEGRFEPVRSIEGGPFRFVRSLHRDSTGTLWFASGKRGLYRSQNGTVRRELPPDQFSSRVFALHRADSGALWIGTRSQGVARYENGTITWYGPDDGLPYSTVRDVHETPDGTVWVATYGGGIARFEGTHFTAVTPEQGLPDGTVHAIHETPKGFFWMTSNAGVFRVPRARVEAVADGVRDRIYPQTFGPTDGMPTRECNGNFQPALAEDENGRLWIPTMKGLTVVNPQRVALSVPDSMAVRVTGVRVDGRSRSLDSLRLDPSAYRLAIRFSAFSLRHADDLSFRYRLDGGQWTVARSRRMAEYTGLEAGSHRMEVQATLNGETWYSLRTPLRFTVAPHFYETRWFRLLIVLGVLGLLVGGYVLRVRVLRHRQEKLQGLVDERTQRLAEEKRKRERQAERLETLDAEKSQFFANVSHELRTPVTILRGALDDLLDGAFGEISVPVQEQLEILRSNVERLHRLTEQLLDLARLETAEPGLDIEPRDLAVLVRRVTRRFAPLAERRGLRLDLETAVDTHPCRFDPQKVEKIVGNLISNALENTPAGGEVTVRFAVEEGDPPEAVLRVLDTSSGIPPARQEEVFERFVGGEDSMSEQGGTGMGLALAREYVELHDGTINVCSAPAEGSTFTVRLLLPLVDAEAVEFVDPPGDGLGEEPASAPNRKASAPCGDGAAGSSSEDPPVLLMVEDNEDVRAYLRRHFAETYRVVEATDGKDGLETARDVEPDLILSDLMMPEMDGVELCRRVRDDEDLARTPIVVLTARADEDDTVAALEAGADAYVTKPSSIDALRARLRRLLEAHWAGATADSPPRYWSPDVNVTSADEEFLDQVTDAIDEHLAHASFTVEDLAAEVGLSPRQLERKLKQLTGTTPAAFVRQYRLDVAAQLLAEETGTVSEIAYGVGFGTRETFTKRFKERFGCRPSAYPDAVPDHAP